MDTATRAFYIRKTVEHGWSRNVLIHQLDTNLHKRLGKAPSNFALTLPSPQSDLAGETLKDSYIFKTAPLALNGRIPTSSSVPHGLAS
jgi:Uncharacterized conserved protein